MDEVSTNVLGGLVGVTSARRGTTVVSERGK